MKPLNVSSILMTGCQTLCMSSLLLEGAIHYAELGYSVLYISASEFQSLPPPVHGLPRPTPDVFSLIRFMYLPRWQDLLQHLFSLHLHSHVPSVLIIEGLQHFLTNHTSEEDNASTSSEASHSALVFAALLDGAAVCAKRTKTRAYLVVSLGQDVSWPLIDLFFSDVVWIFNKKDANLDCEGRQEISVQSLHTLDSQSKTFHLQFVSYPSSVVLNKASVWKNISQSLKGDTLNQIPTTF